MNDVPGRRTRVILRAAKVLALLAVLALLSPFALEVALGVVTSMMAGGCDSARFGGSHPLVEAMQREARSACRKAGTGREAAVTIDVAALSDRPWDRVHFVPPYWRRLATARQIGLDWNVLACTRSYAYDEWSQMVFIDGNEAVTYFDIPTHGLFAYPVIAQGHEGYGRQASKLQVVCGDEAGRNSAAEG